VSPRGSLVETKGVAVAHTGAAQVTALAPPAVAGPKERVVERVGVGQHGEQPLLAAFDLIPATDGYEQREPILEPLP
jgi:hypothetical protein